MYFHVYNTLGYGFLEKVYEDALVLSLRKRGLHPARQVPLKVVFEGDLVEDYFADIIVNDVVIIEVKAAESLRPSHEAQLLNYLMASDIEVGLLLNFGEKPEFRRMIFSNNRK